MDNVPPRKKSKKQLKDTITIEAKSPEDETATEKATFESLGLMESLVESCERLKWKAPTDIQQASIPWALKGRDIIGLAKTGSGKTGAFVLPILQALLKAPQNLFALIIAPTRELAFQIAEKVEALGSKMGVTCATVVGGVDAMQQALILAKKPHFVVGTPGRIVYHLQNTKGFALDKIKFLVLDEADRLLNLDFEDSINSILAAIPTERNTYLFSATMTSKVEKLQRASLTDPVKVEVSAKFDTVDKLVQKYLLIPEQYKECYLAYLLNDFSGKSCIVFASQCTSAQRLALVLRALGFEAVPIHGKLDQPKRLAALNKFKSGQRKILVATDVASRGLDIPDVDIVLNYDIPSSTKDYIHRVGRTARAGNAGQALSLVTQYDVENYLKIEGEIGKKLDLYQTEEDTVLILMERVTEALRLANTQMREFAAKRGKKRGHGEMENGKAEDSEKNLVKFSNKKSSGSNKRRKM